VHLAQTWAIQTWATTREPQFSRFCVVCQVDVRAALKWGLEHSNGNWCSQNLKPSPTRPLMSPAPFGRDCCSGSTFTPISRDQAPFNGTEVSSCPSPPAQEPCPPPAKELLPPLDACGSVLWEEPGVVLLVPPLDVSCPGGVGLTDLGSANELVLAIRLSRRAAQQTMTGLPAKSSMTSPPLLRPSPGADSSQDTLGRSIRASILRPASHFATRTCAP
jgi:hypothetical protein